MGDYEQSEGVSSHYKGYHFGSFCLSLRLDYLLLALLFGTLHNKRCTLSFLLRYLSTANT